MYLVISLEGEKGRDTMITENVKKVILIIIVFR